MEIYLIHGADEVQVQNERLRIVSHLLPEDQRDENLTEFSASGNRQLTLSSILPDLLAELGTISFFPGATRVVVVHQLADFSSTTKESPEKSTTKKKKGTGKALDPSERIIKYFEDDFESTGNAVVFTFVEDPDKRISVDGKKKLAAWIKAHGKLRTLDKGRPSAWALGDAILEKDITSALSLFRLMYRKGSTDQAMSIFNTILRQVNLLLQAKILASARQKHDSAFIDAELFPKDAKTNLLKMSGYPQRKVLDAAPYFKVDQLTACIQDLYEVNKYLIPASGDVYVADVGLLMEKALINLCSKEV